MVTLKLDSYISFRNCSAAYEGGAIFAYDSHVKANGKTHLHSTLLHEVVESMYDGAVCISTVTVN